MIRLIKNKDIDRDKWDRLIAEKGNSRMYALSGYLDAVCRDWNAVIYGDYEVVMPIPIKKMWTGRLRFDMPLFIQQLGIIGLKDSDQELKYQFIELASGLYPNFIHSFNHENGLIELDGFKSTDRTNYELDLNKSYEAIRQGFSDNLIRNLKKSSNAKLTFRLSTKFDLLESFISHYSNSDDSSPKHVRAIKEITEIKQLHFSSKIFSVCGSGDPIAVCLAPSLGMRITLLIPRSSDDGRSVNAMAFLIDSIIRQYSESEMILDFEGSMLPGVAQFYKGFGAVDRKYTVLSL